MSVFRCNMCTDTWIDKTLHKGPFYMLQDMHYRMCKCSEPTLNVLEYDQQELNEIYFTATSPSGENTEEAYLRLSVKELLELHWIEQKEDNRIFLTLRGVKLLPLAVIVAWDLCP